MVIHHLLKHYLKKKFCIFYFGWNVPLVSALLMSVEGFRQQLMGFTGLGCVGVGDGSTPGHNQEAVPETFKLRECESFGRLETLETGNPCFPPPHHSPHRLDVLNKFVLFHRPVQLSLSRTHKTSALLCRDFIMFVSICWPHQFMKLWRQKKEKYWESSWRRQQRGAKRHIIIMIINFIYRALITEHTKGERQNGW